MSSSEVSSSQLSVQTGSAASSKLGVGMIDIVGRSRVWFSVSALVLLIGLASMAFSLATLKAPLRLGIDFSGGTLLEVRFEEPVSTEAIRAVLEAQDLGNSVIQLDTSTDQIALIRTPPLAESERLAVESSLQDQIGPFRRDRVETVGPTVGGQLLRIGLTALLISFGLIVLYLGFRFQLDYAVFAIVALMHDVLLTTGIFSVLGLTLGTEVDSLFIVALLTIIGFSVNDTVVIYDRIRENRRLLSRKVKFGDVVNLSLNQTFARSINTTVTTMLAILAIFLFGGPTLKDFSLALLVGFSLGAYSSIFIAGPLLSWWQDRHLTKAQMVSEFDEAIEPEDAQDPEAAEAP